MDFRPVNIHLLFSRDVCCFTSASLLEMPTAQSQAMTSIIDTLGAAAAKTQRLVQPATTTEKLLSSDHRLYIAPMPPFHVLGYIKVGSKKLLVKSEGSPMKECEPVCVLDFYVCEKYQRTGIGYLIFERMLMQEKCNPAKLAYDCPSQAFLRFLERHFKLTRQLPQSNNFIVFEQFFREDGYTAEVVNDQKLPTLPVKLLPKMDQAGATRMTPSPNSLSAERHNHPQVQGLHLSDGLLQSTGSQSSRTPSAGRRKGVPQANEPAPASLTRGSSTRRLEHRGNSSLTEEAPPNEIPKAVVAFQPPPKPLTRGVSLAFPKASLSMKIITDIVPSNVSFSSSESITPTLPKPDLIAPWESKSADAPSIPDTKQKDTKTRPSSVGTIGLFHRTGAKLDTRDNPKDAPEKKPRGSRREEAKKMIKTLSSRFGHSSSASPSSSSPSNGSPSSESPISQANGGNGSRSASNSNPRRIKSLFS